MLTLKFLRDNINVVKESCRKRNFEIDFEVFESNEKERLKLIRLIEDKKAEKNRISKEIGNLKKINQSADKLLKEMKESSKAIKELEISYHKTEYFSYNFCLSLPNLLDKEVPEGKDENNNIEVRSKGEIPTFNFQVLNHYEIGEKKDWLDFERASKIAGSRFVVVKNKLAKLQRALIAFLLDENIKAGYQEIIPPSIASDQSLVASGQLPKFGSDMFRLNDNFANYYLISTSEIQLINLHRNEILKEQELPISYTALTPCFRSEAGSAGKDTRGMIRLHEFQKVELVKYTTQETSENEHQKMVLHVESLLEKLELPYRVMLLCSGDTGFNAAKCYDLEVWFPGQKKYREISSCSNCRDFQAHRANIRFKNISNNKNEFVHLLNGSSLPIGRTIAAILENYQQENGSVKIPKVLSSYMNNETILD